jgi:hypothetical protein
VWVFNVFLIINQVIAGVPSIQIIPEKNLMDCIEDAATALNLVTPQADVMYELTCKLIPMLVN